jgi:hypothetical protein
MSRPQYEVADVIERFVYLIVRGFTSSYFLQYGKRCGSLAIHDSVLKAGQYAYCIRGCQKETNFIERDRVFTSVLSTHLATPICKDPPLRHL